MPMPISCIHAEISCLFTPLFFRTSRNPVEMDQKLEPLSVGNTRVSPGYHLLTTIAVVVWSLFIVITLMIYELAHHATWNPDRVAAGRALPWGFTVLPSILRTVFDQAHGPITAMHLARLAVGSLDAPWASASTWMEVFWLSDRRWAGPLGLWMTFETLISRKLRRQRLQENSLSLRSAMGST